MNEASLRQIQAADPRVSTWLSANAGSGKTRVLTDRVARLLLRGASPQHILCLTYTKAAASEMQNRLFARLGAWAMTPDAALRDELATLGLGGEIDAAQLARARTLFAQAIETPGGLKIQTIHSFCASLLRRFPLESGVSPGFVEMDDRKARQLIGLCLEDVALRHGDAFDAMARHLGASDLDALAADIAKARDAFARPFDPRRALGLEPDDTLERVLANAFAPGDDALLDRVAPVMAAGSPMDRKAAEKIAALRAMERGLERLAAMEDLFLTGSGAGAPFSAKTGKLPTKATREALGGVVDALDDLMVRIERLRPRRLAVQAAGKARALQDFARAFLPLYASRKAQHNWLDFDDLILKARDLLTQSTVTPWILYKLDGGIDHILVDEAQDTAPVQWEVIEALAQEFGAGRGRDTDQHRTFFVVGDKKQSIYSFQGADADAFDRMRDRFATRLSAGPGLARLQLLHSFRSSSAILRAVDAVFEGELGAGLGREIGHLAFHETLPGRVDLWPIMPGGEAEEDPPWHDPVDRIAPTDANVILAEAVAAEIRRLIDAGETIPRADGTRRPMSEGDVLILVQRRSPLFHEIIRACKRRGLAVAGADRLKLNEELAVKDIRALLCFLATPEDSLSLAAALRSPLLGWSEAELFALAHGRGERHLWQVLRERRLEHPETLEILDDLRREADFLRPFELIERLLMRHDGRHRLLARLGLEAQDAIDELLTQALAYERTDVPSLTGFLAWLEADDVEVRRQAGGATGTIRVMTVHGAKGLEAPVVILPDTLAAPNPRAGSSLMPSEPGGVVWKTVKEEMPAPMREAEEMRQAADRAERARLLYVAMTRAETWLIVCGAGDPERSVEGKWYGQIADGLARCATGPLETPAGTGRRLVAGDWGGGCLRPGPAAPPPPPALPAWTHRHAPPPAETPGPVSPSDLGGAKALPGAGGLDEDAALGRGTRIHRLLEHLPPEDPASWRDLARRLVGEAPDLDGIVEEAGRMLRDPALSHVFAADTLREVPVTATLPQLGGRRMLGAIDRLVVGPDAVLAVDFKSNAVVPARAEEVPDGLLRQMGAYRAALEQIYPGRAIGTAILWTRSAQLMALPEALVSASLAAAAPP